MERSHEEWVSKIKKVFSHTEMTEEKVSSHSLELKFRRLWEQADKGCRWIKENHPEGNQDLVNDLIKKVAVPADLIYRQLDKKTKKKLLPYMYPNTHVKKQAVKGPSLPASKPPSRPSFKKIQQKDLMGKPLVIKKKIRRKIKR